MHVVIVADSVQRSKIFAKDHPVFQRPTLKNFRSPLEGYGPDVLFILLVDVEPPVVFTKMMLPYLRNGQVIVTMAE